MKARQRGVVRVGYFSGCPREGDGDGGCLCVDESGSGFYEAPVTTWRPVP